MFQVSQSPSQIALYWPSTVFSKPHTTTSATLLQPTWWTLQPLWSCPSYTTAGNFPKFTQLNFTISCPCAVMPNGRSPRSWKVLEGKAKQGFGAQLSARRSLLLSVCSASSENSGSVDRVNNMLSFFFVKVSPPWHCTLCTQAQCTAKLSLANWWF